MKLTARQISEFRHIVYDYYRVFGRHSLPWRTTHTTPYHVLVSEIMLQQTQVDRVVPKFLAFCKKFPDINSLAAAPQSEVIRAWSGLGYNRRGMYIHKAAEQIVKAYNGIVPNKKEILLTIPGIGSYTATSIPAFAYNISEVVIDTNIRSIYIHHFFPNQSSVADTELIPLIRATLDKENPRDWYSALMDYGVYLKNTVGNVTKQSRHYSRQSQFQGSRRQIRGTLVRLVLPHPLPLLEIQSTLAKLYPSSRYNISEIIEDLVHEKIISIHEDQISLFSREATPIRRD